MSGSSSLVWVTLTATGPADAQREVATASITEWWNDTPLQRLLIPTGVKLVFIGANVKMSMILRDSRIQYAIKDGDTASHLLFYCTTPATPQTILIHVLGYAQLSDFADRYREVRIRDLLRAPTPGYAEWRSKFPCALKIKDAVVDAETGEVLEQEIWRYPQDAKDSVQVTRSGRSQFFIFPLMRCVGPGSCSREALYRRGVYFVAESGWRGELADAELWANWKKSAGADPRGRPAPLQHNTEQDLAKAYFYAAAGAAVGPGHYRETRDRVEQSYLRYRIAEGGFKNDERATLALLHKNGLSDWLLDCADSSDHALFRKLHPDEEAHPSPVLAGWVPIGDCPSSWLTERPLRKGKVRVFYPDVEQLVLHCMATEARLMNARMYAASATCFVSDTPLSATVRALSGYADDHMVKLHDGTIDPTRFAGVAGSSRPSTVGGDAAGGSLDMGPEELINVMPPCMRRMYDSSAAKPRNLRDGERHWFARFLVDLGYPQSMYETLIRPNWEAEQLGLGTARTDDSRWRAAWDPSHVWKKGYAKITCAAIVAQTMEPVQTYQDPKSKRMIAARRCECPYARGVKYKNPAADIETLALNTSAHCFSEWAKANPGKVRSNEKPLYYPSQYVYLNMRRTRQARIEIAYDDPREDAGQESSIGAK